MDKIGIRELRRHASAIIRRVAAGETFEITDRGHVVALLVRKSARGPEPLIEPGMVQAVEGNVLDGEPLQIPANSRPPSSSIAEGVGKETRKRADPH